MHRNMASMYWNTLEWIATEMTTFKCPLILASQSPRRLHLLKMLGWEFTVHISETEEHIPSETLPENIVQALAMQKAETVAAFYDDALILGADTIVVANGHVLGKPTSERHAFQMLNQLRNNTHTVYTGIALIHPKSHRNVTAFTHTDVTFGRMSDAEIHAYIATGSPMDKAGAYGIQDDAGALFISKIEGDYYNVVGLPLHLLYQTLKDFFGDLLGWNDNLINAK